MEGLRILSFLLGDGLDSASLKCAYICVVTLLAHSKHCWPDLHRLADRIAFINQFPVQTLMGKCSLITTNRHSALRIDSLRLNLWCCRVQDKETAFWFDSSTVREQTVVSNCVISRTSVIFLPRLLYDFLLDSSFPIWSRKIIEIC